MADYESRKLAYLNAMSAPDCDQAALDKEYPDVARELRDNATPSVAVLVAPKSGSRTLTIGEAVGFYGAMALVLVALPLLTDEDREEVFNLLAGDPADLETAANEAAGEADAALDLEKAATGKADGGDGPADTLPPSGVATPVTTPATGTSPAGLPGDWATLQWKQRVKLARDHGGGTLTLEEADAYLADLDAKALAADQSDAV